MLHHFKDIFCLCGTSRGTTFFIPKAITRTHTERNDIMRNRDEISSRPVINQEPMEATFPEKFDSVSDFPVTYKAAPYAQFDDEHRIMILAQKPHILYKPKHFTIFRYDQIINVDLIQNGENLSITEKSGLGRAAAGGLMFGGAGAVVGALSGKKKTKSEEICKELKLRITVRDYDDPAFYITIINTPQKTNGFVYKSGMKEAHNILSQLEKIIDEEQYVSDVRSPEPSGNITEEIREFKALMDEGIITEEEFNAKKKELLDI